MASEAQQIDPQLLSQLANAVNQANQGLMVYQLDPTQELETLRIHLLALVWSEEEDDYVPDEHRKPMINEAGYYDILSLIRLRVTKIFSLSNQDIEDINQECKDFLDSLTFMLCRHFEEYAIESLQKLDCIIELAHAVVRSTMLKSQDGWEGDGIRKQHTTVESRETYRDERPRSSIILNPFNQAGRRGGN